MSKFSRWSGRLGTPNQHNASLPRDFWLEDWEKAAIIAFHALYPLEGYRRLAYMMLDADVVAVSPSSVYRVLKAAGKLSPRGGKPSKKGQGFEQPLRPHEHWHIDVSYLNICGTFFFLCSILDGYSRFVIHWEIRETMKEAEVETIIQRAREQYPGERPRIISDNGPQFIARDFKEFIRICGMTHVRTSPFYPQSNGKIERWFKTLKGGCIRVITPARKFRILPYTNPTRQRGLQGTPLAGASGSSRRTATLVTPSAQPVVSAAVLLELARWCQQRLALMEDGNQCVDAQLDPPRPPFCAPGHDCQGPGHPQLATVGPQHPGGPAFPSDPDDRAPRPKVVRKRRKEGSR